MVFKFITSHNMFQNNIYIYVRAYVCVYTHTYKSVDRLLSIHSKTVWLQQCAQVWKYYTLFFNAIIPKLSLPISSLSSSTLSTLNYSRRTALEKSPCRVHNQTLHNWKKWFLIACILIYHISNTDSCEQLMKQQGKLRCSRETRNSHILYLCHGA